MPRHCRTSSYRPATGAYAMCGVVVGVALQLQQHELSSPLAYVVAVCIGILGLLGALRGHRALAWWGAWCMGLAFAWGVTGWRATAFEAQQLQPQWEGVDVRVEGVVLDMPKPLERGRRFRFQVEQAYADVLPRQPIDIPPGIALTWYGQPPPEGLRAGQRWCWTVRLKAPSGARNPHGTDWELWLWSQNIQATGYVRALPPQAPPRYMGQTAQAWWAQWRGHLLARMQVPAEASAREAAAWGVVQALVTGAQSQMHRADWQLFRDTGIVHLVSISGLHITMFAWLAMAVVQAVWRCAPRWCLRCPAPIAGAWAGLVLATGYALLSGWGIPAQRTIGMLCVVVWLRSQGRAWPYVWLLILTAVLLVDPWSLLQAGFWLSFVAVGVLFATQPQGPDTAERGWQAAGRRLLYEQLVLGLALAPLTVVLFGQISVVGLLANVWAIPWVTLVVTPLAMLGALWPVLWGVAAKCVALMVEWLELMAAWPLSVLYFAQAPWWAKSAGVLGCVWMVMPWGWRWRLMGLPWALPLVWWSSPAPTYGHFSLWALDVGQGSAVLVRTQQHSVLFDAGPRWSAQSDAGADVVVPWLRAIGVRPAAMVISHADGDHAGGATSVVQAFAPMQRWGAGGQPCVQGQSWWWDGVYFEMLHPVAVAPGAAPVAVSSNASSCVLRVHAQSGARALLTGDIEAAQEQVLLETVPDLHAQVLLVPHHGSKTSSSLAFVQAVHPQVAIVQAGYRNRFGHPAQVVVQRYQALGVQLWSTHSCGAVSWHSWQPTQATCEREQHKRYWHRVLE